MLANRKFWMVTGLISSLWIFSSCAIFLVGAGVGGGLAISKDEIEGLVEKPFDRVWSVSRQVVMEEGFIKLENRPGGEITAEIRKSEVKITVRQMTDKTVRLRVQARKGLKLIPDLDLANELYNKIFSKLK